jgi:hypothetical protein
MLNLSPRGFLGRLRLGGGSSANLVGLNWLNLTFNLTLNLMLNLSPQGFLGRPRLGGGI